MTGRRGQIVYWAALGAILLTNTSVWAQEDCPSYRAIYDAPDNQGTLIVKRIGYLKRERCSGDIVRANFNGRELYFVMVSMSCGDVEVGFWDDANEKEWLTGLVGRIRWTTNDTARPLSEFWLTPAGGGLPVGKYTFRSCYVVGAARAGPQHSFPKNSRDQAFVFGNETGCDAYRGNWDNVDDRMVYVTQDEVREWETYCPLEKPSFKGRPMQVTCSGEGEEWSRVISLVFDPKRPDVIIYSEPGSPASSRELRRCE